MGKIGKSLTNLLRTTAVVSILGIPLFFTGCKKPAEINPAPQAQLVVNPTSGNAPLNTSIQLSKTGDYNIKNYKLIIDNKQIRNANYPLDTIIKFRNAGDYSIIGQVEDYEGQTGSKYVYLKVGPHKEDIFKQPNDSTDNYYGSGKVILDSKGKKPIDKKDLDRLVLIINGEFSDPSDPMLMDRCDVTGNEKVDSNDLDILSKKVNGTIPYLPGEWNELTAEEQENWFEKMRKIDKTDEIPWSPQFDCTKFSYQTRINFNGCNNSKDISRLTAFYPFDFSNNGRFNIPVQELQLVEYNSNGNPIDAHDINVVFFKNSTSDFNSIKKFEPQDDNIDPHIGEGYLSQFGTNSKLYIRGFPTLEFIGGISSTEYLTYKVENNIITLTHTNPNLITKREK